MVTLVKLEQSLNVAIPIHVTVDGMVILFKPVQRKYTYSWIPVTPSGIVTFVRLTQSESICFNAPKTGWHIDAC